MSTYEPTKQHLREVLLYFFNSKKNASESHRLLSEAYPEYAPTIRVCQEWFARFRRGDFRVEDKERPGEVKKFEDEELEELLREDSGQTQEQLALSLGVTQQAISKRLAALGMIQKQGNWVPYKLKPTDVEQRFFMCELLLARQIRKKKLHRIVTGDEKWIHYDNPKRKRHGATPAMHQHRPQSQISTTRN